MEVIVCDDHPIVAVAIAMTIETAFNAVVHVASSYRQAKTLASKHSNVRLCLLDIHVPGEDARAGVRDLKSALPDARFLLFSGSDQDGDLMLTFNLGLHGFLPKSSAPEVVEAALRLVLAGGTYLPSRIGQLAMGHTQLGDDITLTSPLLSKTDGNCSVSRLTSRQHLVLQQVALGRSNKEIARDMTISPATVKAHVALIIATLGVANRTEASVRARDLGLI
jgi:two-component system nitrate/nitrite response regulator NarL